MKLLAKCSLFLGMVALMGACTDLEEDLNDNLTRTEAETFLNANTDVSALLESAYRGLDGPFQDQALFRYHYLKCIIYSSSLEAI